MNRRNPLHSRLRAFGSVVLAVLGIACGPVGPIPGTRLSGNTVEGPVSDWSFSDAQMEIQVETRGTWLPHSVTTICMSAGNRLYVPSRNAPGKVWVQNILRDPRVRLRVGGQVYERLARRVTDESELEPAARNLLRKYYGLEVEHVRLLADAPSQGDDRAELWVFRMDPRGAAP